MEFKEFDEKINGVPYWVKTKKDMFVYARHLAYRMYEARELTSLYKNELRKLASQSFKDKEVSEKFKKMYKSATEEFMESVWDKEAEICQKLKEFYNSEANNLDKIIMEE